MAVLKTLMNECLSTDGAVLINGVSIDDEFPDTPDLSDYCATHKRSYVSETSLTYVSTLLGCMKNYQYEKGGAYIHNIYLVKKLQFTASNSGNKSDLQFHNEIAFDPGRPDFIVLLGLRQDESMQAKTRLSSVEAMMQQLSREEIDLLGEKKFEIKSPVSFSNVESKLSSIINMENGQLKCAFNFNTDRVTAIKESAQRVLDKARNIFERDSISVCIKPGDMLILDNRKVVHGRTKYSGGQCGGQNRWLQRAYVCQ